MVLGLESQFSLIQNPGSEVKLLPGGARLKGKRLFCTCHRTLAQPLLSLLYLSLLAQGHLSGTNLVQAFPSVHGQGCAVREPRSWSAAPSLVQPHHSWASHALILS